VKAFGFFKLGFNRSSNGDIAINPPQVHPFLKPYPFFPVSRASGCFPEFHYFLTCPEHFSLQKLEDFLKSCPRRMPNESYELKLDNGRTDQLVCPVFCGKEWLWRRE
jgi:hypothetical protein